ncbi:MAG: pyridoxal 5'-phosphate synthase glutaminase subunit PdxT, partial [Spirochaetales bacterium]|nr:pyridoxal 5'-phosphate synthase glutaminase subunit PdxT [Spirochaetales bacterium]
GLVIPGGESTTLNKLLKIKKLDEGIIEHSYKGLHLWGTCAGLIILANNLKLIELDIERNAYGSQINSFSSKIKFCNDNISVKFIRAPKIVNVGKNVDVLSVHNGDVIAVSNKNVFATTFHPEVTLDDTVYNYFTSRIRN